jgi:hypothetical protein
MKIKSSDATRKRYFFDAVAPYLKSLTSTFLEAVMRRQRIVHSVWFCKPQLARPTLTLLVIMLFCGIPQRASATPIFAYFLNGLRLAPLVFTLISQRPNPSPNPEIAMTFRESIDQMTFEFSGGDINFDTSVSVRIDGMFWSGTAGITEDSGIFFDDVSLSGNFTHINGPHGGDGMGWDHGVHDGTQWHPAAHFRHFA